MTDNTKTELKRQKFTYLHPPEKTGGGVFFSFKTNTRAKRLPSLPSSPLSFTVAVGTRQRRNCRSLTSQIPLGPSGWITNEVVFGCHGTSLGVDVTTPCQGQEDTSGRGGTPQVSARFDKTSTSLSSPCYVTKGKKT